MLTLKKKEEYFSCITLNTRSLSKINYQIILLNHLAMQFRKTLTDAHFQDLIKTEIGYLISNIALRQIVVLHSRINN